MRLQNMFIIYIIQIITSYILQIFKENCLLDCFRCLHNDVIPMQRNLFLIMYVIIDVQLGHTLTQT